MNGEALQRFPDNKKQASKAGDPLRLFAAALLCAPFEPLGESIETIVRESELKAEQVVAAGRAPVARKHIVGFQMIYRALREQAAAVRPKDVTTGPRSMRALNALSLLRQRQRALLIFDSLVPLKVAEAAVVLGIGQAQAQRLTRSAEAMLAKALGGPWDVRLALRTAARQLSEPPAQEEAPPVPPRIPRPVVRLLLAEPQVRAPGPPVFNTVEPSTIDELLARAEAEPADFVAEAPPKPPIPIPKDRTTRRWVLPKASAVVIAATVLVLAALIPFGSQSEPRRVIAPVVESVHVETRAAHPVAKVEVVRIQAGDTLWAIAGQRLGDPMRWREIWHANRNRIMRGGERFTDPNLIRPGWRLRLSG
jgi:nucleoid-associated protein YgaU